MMMKKRKDSLLVKRPEPPSFSDVLEDMTAADDDDVVFSFTDSILGQDESSSVTTIEAEFHQKSAQSATGKDSAKQSENLCNQGSGNLDNSNLDNSHLDNSNIGNGNLDNSNLDNGIHDEDNRCQADRNLDDRIQGNGSLDDVESAYRRAAEFIGRVDRLRGAPGHLGGLCESLRGASEGLRETVLGLQRQAAELKSFTLPSTDDVT